MRRILGENVCVLSLSLCLGLLILCHHVLSAELWNVAPHLLGSNVPITSSFFFFFFLSPLRQGLTK